MLATYAYTADGLLDEVCGSDPDNDPANAASALCATYGYTTVAGRTLLATVTPPGQAPWTFAYDATGRLKLVTRPEDNTIGGTGTATWTVRYDLPLTTPGLPDLSASTATQWGQETEDLPTTAAAVFTPGRVPAGTPTAEDLKYASLWYFDADGTTTNTATYGAGAWLVDTSWYDPHGNVIRHLDGAGRARALAEPVAADRPAVAQAASTLTVFNDTPTSDAVTEGTRVEAEYGPAHTVTLTNGTQGLFRSRTEYVYDDEPAGAGPGGPKPTGRENETFNLVVETRHSATGADRTGTHDLTVVQHQYDPVVAGDGNGWELGMPTRVRTQLADGSWSTQVTRYDTKGRQVETRQPGGATNTNGAGADAHAVVTSYYATTATDEDCSTDPARFPGRRGWDGLVCKNGPAAQPAGQTMPVTHHKTYDGELRPVEVIETSGVNADGTPKVARTTTSSYDNLGRPVTTAVLAGGDTRTTTLAYHPATGLPIRVTGSGDPVATGYDTWGRVKSYTDGAGMTSTTSYTPESQVAAFHDGEGTYAYTYRNPTVGEYRPLPVTVDVGLAAGTPDESTLAYNAAGAHTKVTYPNGMTADYGYTEAGVPTALAYTDANGTPLLGFGATVDADGRVHGYTSDASRQDYEFDSLGRLVKTEDYRTNPDTSVEECTTRTYGFSAASERTSYHSYGPAATDGACQTSSPTVAKNNSYDTANRITNPGYSYDNLGRTLTTPAADTAPGATSPLSAAYHANDMIKTLTQTVTDSTGASIDQRVDYTLDATGRINTITNQTNGTETSRLRYRFSDHSDVPTTIRESGDSGATWTTTRYLSIPGMALAASVTSGQLSYELANLHGDIVGVTTGVLLDGYFEFDEYGNGQGAVAPPFGWLGAQQRSQDSIAGQLLFGARLYNPQSGQFESVDPVSNGGATRYGYPFDPLNGFDLDGQRWWGPWHFYLGGPLGISPRAKRSLHFSAWETRYIAEEGFMGYALAVAGGAGGVLGGLLKYLPDSVKTLLGRLGGPFAAAMSAITVNAYLVTRVARDAVRRRKCMRLTLYFGATFVTDKAWVESC